MSVWDSVRTAVDRVTGSSAHISVAVDRGVVRLGEDVKIQVSVKNGPARLEARALLLEIEGVEAIDLPRHANTAHVIEDIAASVAKKPGVPQPAKPNATVNSTKTFDAKITISAGLILEPGAERKFDGRFKLPTNVQPTYEGKYAQHAWRFRVRLDVFGTDPDSGWYALKVLNA